MSSLSLESCPSINHDSSTVLHKQLRSKIRLAQNESNLAVGGVIQSLERNKGSLALLEKAVVRQAQN